ncbi:MAG TPA: hypothetical protein PLY45_01820, partial [bacterium]|nr:hypothetical protein [bacterium]
MSPYDNISVFWRAGTGHGSPAAETPECPPPLDCPPCEGEEENRASAEKGGEGYLLHKLTRQVVAAPLEANNN